MSAEAATERVEVATVRAMGMEAQETAAVVTAGSMTAANVEAQKVGVEATTERVEAATVRAVGGVKAQEAQEAAATVTAGPVAAAKVEA